MLNINIAKLFQQLQFVILSIVKLS